MHIIKIISQEIFHPVNPINYKEFKYFLVGKKIAKHRLNIEILGNKRMKYIFQVENIKCGGCTNTIATKLREIDGVKDVTVNLGAQEVTVSAESEIQADMRSKLAKKLARLGYPEAVSASSNSMITKATSFVSCALGKVSGKH